MKSRRGIGKILAKIISTRRNPRNFAIQLRIWVKLIGFTGQNAKAAVAVVALAPVIVPTILIGEIVGTFVPWIYEPVWVKDAKATHEQSKAPSG